MVKIKVNEIKETLHKHFPGTVIFFGGPGIGKSEQVREFAREKAEKLGLNFVEWDDRLTEGDLKNAFILLDMRLYEVTPEDFFIPRETSDGIVFKYNRPLRALGQHPGVLFLDEISNTVRPDVQSILFKLLLDKRVGWLKLHKDVMVIGAGNPPEYSEVATELATPIMNRAAIYEVEHVSVKEWISYETEKGRLNHYVATYLLKHPEHFYLPPQKGATSEPYPTPRSWTLLSCFLNNNPDFTEADCQAFLGGEVGSNFFLSTRYRIPSVEDILKNPLKLHTINSIDKLYNFAFHVAMWVRKHPDRYKEVENKILLRMLKRNKEFLVVTLHAILKGWKKDEIEKILQIMHVELRELLSSRIESADELIAT